MKPVTVDMLRAHLGVASLTAMSTEVLAFLPLLVSQDAFSSTPFRLLAIVVIGCGVIVTRQFASATFEFAVQRHQATLTGWPARPVAIASDCPRRWLVILHLRLTARPFMLAEH